MRFFSKTITNKLYSEIITIPEVLNTSHIPGLDGLRGISILIVIISHIFIETPYKPLFSGDVGVEIFFVISGFLITTLLLKEKVLTGSISLKKFYLRRVLRIIPVAYLYLIVLVVLNMLLKLNIHSLSFVSAFIFIQNIPVKVFFSWFTSHFWSLSVEEQFYITFPFLLASSIKKYTKIIVILIIIFTLISFLGYTKVGIFYSNKSIHIVTFIVVNLLSKSVCILIGSLFSILLFKGLLKVPNITITRYLSIPLFVFAVLMHTPPSPLYIPYSGLFIFPLLIAIVIVLNLDNSSVFLRLLNNPVLVYLGMLSYSLYIWQQLFSSPENSILRTNSLLTNITVLFIVANLSYYLYEKRFIKMKKRFKVENTH
jgi:peptidoglycan/LPS O-acetylase OafA/YrhL